MVIPKEDRVRRARVAIIVADARIIISMAQTDLVCSKKTVVQVAGGRIITILVTLTATDVDRIPNEHVLVTRKGVPFVENRLEPASMKTQCPVAAAAAIDGIIFRPTDKCIRQ